MSGRYALKTRVSKDEDALATAICKQASLVILLVLETVYDWASIKPILDPTPSLLL